MAGELGIHQRVQLGRPQFGTLCPTAVLTPLGDLDDDHSLTDAHLRRGQAHPGRLVHGLDHVVDQPLHLRGNALDALGFLPQDWVRYGDDLPNAHRR